MKKIKKCYVSGAVSERQRGIICDEIIVSASPNVNPNLVMELNRLINRTQTELTLEHQLQRQFNIRLV